MKIIEKFSELNVKKVGALVAYICAGDPDQHETKRYVEALVRGGADIIELGLPFSDPVADGPIIRAGMERALNSGMNTDLYFELAGSLEVNVPVVAMTYYNLIFNRGHEKFARDCTSSGISGIIVPDLPVEESEELGFVCKKYGIDLIFLVGQTTTGPRMDRILDTGTGFIYIVSRPGVTGVKDCDHHLAKDVIMRVHTTLPKVVGFGISRKEQAYSLVSAGADGVIAGSAFVDIIASGRNVPERLKVLASELKDGIVKGSLLMYSCTQAAQNDTVCH
ncbi:MAG TPA: tryptophan synthase subunit alpha [candidate division Zixibacteria bacterium]|nr:tryptophan synthase subunit alpha [candidate division Zixibacteria bacterium]